MRRPFRKRKLALARRPLTMQRPPSPGLVQGIVQGEHDYLDEFMRRRELLKPPTLAGKLGRLAGAIYQRRRAR